MKLKDLRELLANFEASDGEIDVVICDPEIGVICDFDATGSIRFLGNGNEFTYCGLGEKVFFLDIK